MCQEARLFNCQRCHEQIIICRHCDRGNIYCGSQCAEASRRESCRAADVRYEKTQKGKLNRAERQRRYRQRQREKKEIVTDQGSPENTPHDVLPNMPIDPNSESLVSEEPKQRCHFCHRVVSNYLRLGFIRRFSRRLDQKQLAKAQAP